jgi:hypothetical protein
MREIFWLAEDLIASFLHGDSYLELATILTIDRDCITEEHVIELVCVTAR